MKACDWTAQREQSKGFKTTGLVEKLSFVVPVQARDVSSISVDISPPTGLACLLQSDHVSNIFVASTEIFFFFNVWTLGLSV